MRFDQPDGGDAGPSEAVCERPDGIWTIGFRLRSATCPAKRRFEMALDFSEIAAIASEIDEVLREEVISADDCIDSSVYQQEACAILMDFGCPAHVGGDGATVTTRTTGTLTFPTKTSLLGVLQVSATSPDRPPCEKTFDVTGAPKR